MFDSAFSLKVASQPFLHNLPPQPTPFLGRQKELATIKRLITNPDVRLVTIVGPGGMGKTRLAIQAATESLDGFVDGVFFVPLAPISSDVFLTSAVAESLDIAFYGAADPSVQLLNYLQNKDLLLVLDNFEHIMDGAVLLSEIVAAAPGIKLLVTSRERLNLQEEWTLELQGMAFPVAESETSEVSEGVEPPETMRSAVQLFDERAQQVRSDFELTAEYPAVVRICQFVRGMPLGLELAATWVRLMSCQEIADEIARGIDILKTSTRNVPERHRSLRAVFRHSWQLLSDEEKDIFRKLSVFRGGFTREAAEQVAASRGGSPASLLLLSSLADKSVLRTTRTGRYEIHELLRQYAAQELVVGDESETVRDRHSDYYTDFLQQLETDLKGSRQYEAVAAIAADIDNIRAAWRRAAVTENQRALARSWESLYLYYDTSGSSFQEAETAFRQALSAFGGVASRYCAPQAPRRIEPWPWRFTG